MQFRAHGGMSLARAVSGAASSRVIVPTWAIVHLGIAWPAQKHGVEMCYPLCLGCWSVAPRASRGITFAVSITLACDDFPQDRRGFMTAGIGPPQLAASFISSWCRLLARTGPSATCDLSPLSGAKRKLAFGDVRAAVDPLQKTCSRDFALHDHKWGCPYCVRKTLSLGEQNCTASNASCGL